MKLPFLKSSNFWNNFIVFLASIFSAYNIDGVVELTEASHSVVDAIFAGQMTAILIATYNMINMVYHIFFDKAKNIEQKIAEAVTTALQK